LRLSGRCGLTEGPLRGRAWRNAAVLAAAAAVFPGLIGSVGTPGARLDVARAAPIGFTEHASAVIGSSQRRFRVWKTRGALVAASGSMKIAFRRSGPSFAGRAFALNFRSPSIGRGADLSPLPSAQPLARRNRTLYRRWSTTEWYANGPFGVEQGFTVDRRPAGARSARLTLSFRLSGSLVARHVGSRIELARTAHGPALLTYGDVRATDARGRALAARLDLKGKRVFLRVDDTAARYPVTIDPFIEQGSKLTEPGAGYFGLSLALSSDGNTGIVGVPNDHGINGALYVFTRSGSTWTQQGPKLVPSDPGSPDNDAFGEGVALSADGNTALIGGPSDTADNQAEGSAWIFTRSGGTWTQQGSRITGPDVFGEFGWSVSLSADGNAALIGAPSDNISVGAAWLYTRSGTTWSPAGRLTPTGESGAARFGETVALSGDGSTAIVTGPHDASDLGAAWVFANSGGTWSQQGAKLTGSGEFASGEFGASAALSTDGNTALVGGTSVDGAPAQAGAVWAFSRSGGTWSQQGSKLTPSDEGGPGDFGVSLALSGDGNTALIGANQDTGTVGAAIGGAWEFTRSAGTWTQQGSKFTGSGAVGKAGFGQGIALSSDAGTAWIGGIFDNTSEGAVWAYVSNGVSVTPATGGSAISADTTGGAYTSLTGPVLSESAPGQIGTGTVVLNAPTGFVFDAAAAPNCSGTSGLAASVTAHTPTAITCTVTASSSGSAGTLTFSGLTVRPSAGTPLASGSISESGTAALPGATGSYGSLSEIPGAASKLAFTAQPAGAGAGAGLSSSPAVTIEDQFGNQAQSSAAVALAITPGTGTAGAVLSGTTTRNGPVATFTGLSIDRAGTGYTLRATSAGLTAATSSAFDITGGPPPPQVTLTITISGNGSGFVAPAGGFTCYHLNANTAATTCTSSWPQGSVVTLHATPTGASTFTGWFQVGGCIGLGDCTVLMNGNQSETALFNLAPTLTVNVTGDGTGTVTATPAPAGTGPCAKTTFPVGTKTCTYSYAPDATVTLQASATNGSKFVGWSGGCTGTGSCSTTMLEDKTATATFSYDPGVHVNAIEITQGIQTPELPTRSSPPGYRVTYSGVALPWQNAGDPPVTVELAQDHATVVRVYVNTADPRNGQPVPTMTLRAYRDGQLLDPGPIAPDQTPPSSAVPVGNLGANAFMNGTQRYDPKGAYTFTLPWGWAQGDVEFIATAIPGPDSTVPCDAACEDRTIILDGVHFHRVTAAYLDPIAVQDSAFPIGSDLPGNYPAPDPWWSKTQAVVPFPIYVPPYVYTWDVAGSIVAGNSTSTSQNVINAVQAWADSNDSVSSHYPFGVVPKAAWSIIRGVTLSSTYNGTINPFGATGRVLYGDAQPLSEAQENLPLAGLGHEFNHGLGRAHAGQTCGSNSNGQTGEPWLPTPPNDGALDGIGLDTSTVSPYRIISPTSASPVWDLMSYCPGPIGSPATYEAQHWITVRNWNRDVEFRSPEGTAKRIARRAAATFRTNPAATAGSARTLAVMASYVAAAPTATITAVDLDTGAPTPAQPNETYSLAGRDAAGHVVATAGTLVSLGHVDGEAPAISIAGKIALQDVKEVDVLADGKVIARAVASAHAPVADIVAPATHARVGGKHDVLLRWRSHDADGNRLSVTVGYSADGGRNWRTIYAGPDRGSTRLPAYDLTTSKNARLRIYVSDGFNETVATSAPFVSEGSPPIVSITRPTAHVQLAAGAPLELAGSAYDDAANRLVGRSLLWHVGRRTLGTGTDVTTEALGPGRHTVTLTAHDRRGRAQSASVNVTVLAAPPVLILLKAPGHISAKARSATLRLATAATATLTIGRFHSVVGRRARTVRIQVEPGRNPLKLVLTLRSGRYRTSMPVVVAR
jgi:hypothetical protein